MEGLRTGISGPSGSGKTSVAEEVAAHLGIPFLRAKDVTSPILDKGGYDYSEGRPVERFLQTEERQLEILDATERSHSCSSFVTDRTFIDIAAYALAGSDFLRPDVVEGILKKCEALSWGYSHVFILQPSRLVFNARRTMNISFQKMIYLLENGILREWVIPFKNVYGDTTAQKAAGIISMIT